MQVSQKHRKRINPLQQLVKRTSQTFSDEPKEIFVGSIKEAEEIGDLTTSQKQVIIKLIEKNIEIKNSLKGGDQFPC